MTTQPKPEPFAAMGLVLDYCERNPYELGRARFTIEQARAEIKQAEEREVKWRAALQSGVELVESAFAHVSHGGPTRADAEKWLKKAKEAL
jgi:hypothetical protein